MHEYRWSTQVGVDTVAVSPSAEAISFCASCEQTCTEIADGSAPAGLGACVVEVVVVPPEQPVATIPATTRKPRDRARTA